MNESGARAGVDDLSDDSQSVPAPQAPVSEAAGEPSKEPANEPLPTDFGSILRSAREAAGIDAATLAMRLRLHVRQVEALERSDLSALPASIYVRGFLRGCARELGIDPAPLLADLDRRAGAPVGATPAGTPAPLRLGRFGDGSRSIMFVVLAIILVAGVVGVLSQRDRQPAPTAPAVAEPPPPSPAPEASNPAQAAPGPNAPPAAAASEAPAAAAKSGAAAAGTRPVAPVPKPAAAPPAPLAEAPAPPAVAAAPASSPAAPAPSADALVLHVRETSWVEVVQANGSSVFSQICLPGSLHTIRGVAPLRVVIGNASAVDVEYRGAPVDLLQHANANGVARLTLP